MAAVIRFRRGTAAEWTAADPVLQSGEPGFETDSGRHKIGDGSTAWSDLPYFLDEPALEEWYAARPSGTTGATAAGLVVNVKDPAYGAVGDGTTDDTAAIQRAIDATGAGGVCYFPAGVYLVRSTGQTVLNGRSGLTLAGAGGSVSVIRNAQDSGAFRILNLSNRSDVVVRDLGFEGGGSSVIGSAVWASAPNGQRNIWVRSCRFSGFMPGGTSTTYAAVYTWTTDGVHVLDSEFSECGRAVTVDQPDGVARIQGNRISAEPGVMATGIYVRRSSGFAVSEVVVSDNRVTGARLDPGGVGAEGHGIAVFRCRDVQVSNNHAEGNRRGILISNQSFGAIVQGNTCVGNSDAGIRCEPEITDTDVTVGVDAQRGITVIGNVCRNNANDPGMGPVGGANSGIGIAMSYAAGSTVSGNTVHHNTGDGIFCDSDRVAIIGNIVYSNFIGYTADPTTGKRGGIRIIVGSGCTVVGNQCFDNQSPKTQHYGLSMSGAAAHLVHGNNFTGNAVGEVFGAEKIFDSFFGATPVSRRPNPGTANALNTPQVLNNLIESLRQLGLVQ